MSSNSRQKFLCLDCKVDTGKINEFFMLHNSTWNQVCKSNRGMLCVTCLEKRLGRRLNRFDFNDSYINRLSFGRKSQRLLERMLSVG